MYILCNTSQFVDILWIKCFYFIAFWIPPVNVQCGTLLNHKSTKYHLVIKILRIFTPIENLVTLCIHFNSPRPVVLNFFDTTDNLKNFWLAVDQFNLLITFFYLLQSLYYYRFTLKYFFNFVGRLTDPYTMPCKPQIENLCSRCFKCNRFKTLIILNVLKQFF